MSQKIAVIGAGIIGLTSAIRLLENGYDVTVFARDIKTNITSRTAPALWMPFIAAPVDSILKWAAESLTVYQHMADKHGITPKTLIEFYKTDGEPPLWSKIISDYKVLSTAELPENYTRGYSIETYQIDTTLFVDYLQKEVEVLGGKMVQKEFNSLNEVDQQFKIIINCSGVWAGQLASDQESFPIRGQYMLLKKSPQINQIRFAPLDEENYILIVPRTHDIWVGGTTNYHDWNTEVDTETFKHQLHNAQQLEPALQGLSVLSVAVGLRPGRKSVRLEAETLADQRMVIHNYGHGGSGFTVGWGCANQVLDLCRLV